MCGRYQVVTEESELRDIIFSALSNADIDTESYSIGGEVYPTNILPVLVGKDGVKAAKMYKWGFPQYKNNGVIINARAETVESKPMFSSRFRFTRCVVPSSGFYEWSKSKEKYYFTLPGEKVLYMAGLWAEFGGEEPCYVIITKEANDSVTGVHNRMPLVLLRENIEPWLFDIDYARELLNGVVPELECVVV
jgi:putative SOS response-associated peptidase YedK